MIKIISVDDHEMISIGLERVFSETSDIRLCHLCRTKDEAKAFVSSKSPEELNLMIAMLDIKLENESGFDCADYFMERGINCLMYSSYSNTGFIIKTMEHKIKGFVSKNADKSEILDGITTGDKQKIVENVQSWEILQKNLVRFQLKQLYNSYKILIFVIILVVGMSLVFFILYLVSSKSQRETKTFTAQMIKTQEAERECISNELHDTVCQDLRILQFQLENDESVNLCKKIASDVRNSCYALTPSDLSEGFFEALISLCSLLKSRVDWKLF